MRENPLEFKFGKENLQKIFERFKAKNYYEKLSEAEKKYGNTGPMKKAIVARNDIEKGESIDFYNIAYKRTENSSPLQQKEIYKLIIYALLPFRLYALVIYT